jgi:hypothetical protein
MDIMDRIHGTAPKPKVTTHRGPLTPQELKDNYVDATDALYDNIETWLNEIFGDGGRDKWSTIVRNYKSILPSIGETELKMMAIYLGDEDRIILRPIGISVEDEIGRLDINSNTSASYALVNDLSMEKQDWKVYSGINEMPDTTLNSKTAFENLLSELIP